MNVLHVIFSTNRFCYLARTLASARNLDWTGVNRHGLFFDDYPLNRNDALIQTMAQQAGFDEQILHQENQGLSVTWEELNSILRERNYNYVLHQEDDVELLQTVKVAQLIEIFADNPGLSMIKLKRNVWYEREAQGFYDVPHNAQQTGEYLLSRNLEGTRDDFNTMFSLYPAWIARETTPDRLGCNPNEGDMAAYLNTHHRLRTATLSNMDGSNIVRHIGEYFQGKRVLEGEPAHELFSMYDPEKKYCSRTGKPWHSR